MPTSLGWFSRQSTEVSSSKCPDCWPAGGGGHSGCGTQGSLRVAGVQHTGYEEHIEECGYVRKRDKYVVYLCIVIFLDPSRVSR